MATQFDHRIGEMAKNLRRLYRSASPADLAIGQSWYPIAHRQVVEWASQYELPIATVACVTAALSPQVRWPRNLELAADILADVPLRPGTMCYLVNLAKARAILRDRATSIEGYFKSAPKVSAFSQNLAGNDDCVTVDTHACQAALNDPTTTVSLNAPRYRVFAQAYVRAALSIGVAPSTLQAVCWVAWKSRYPTIQKRELRTQGSFVSELEFEERF